MPNAQFVVGDGLGRPVKVGVPVGLGRPVKVGVPVGEPLGVGRPERAGGVQEPVGTGRSLRTGAPLGGTGATVALGPPGLSKEAFIAGS